MIINASPLIIFGKLNKIDILVKLFKNIEISNEVYNEVVIKGRELKDALIVEDYVKKGYVKVFKLDNKNYNLAKKIQFIFSIDFGEAETIALAIQLKQKEAIIDEISAREAAKSLNIKPIGTLGILLMAFKERIINEDEIKGIIEGMVNSKYRVGANVIIEFWDKLKELKRVR